MAQKQNNYIDYSIEYSHIYTDESFNDEHRRGIAELKEQLPKLKDKIVDKVVFIDNYNSTNHILDIEGFLSSVREEGVAHDYYVFEADMVSYADQLFSVITDRRVRKSYESYIERHNKLPCSFLTTIWYFIRLGYFEPNAGIIYGKDVASFVPAKHIINVLPERFCDVEVRTLKLITATTHAVASKNITSVFFASDPKVSKARAIS